MHYLRVRQYGDPGEAETRLVGRSGVCSVEGCDQPIKARGLCRAHYEVADGREVCPASVEGCERPQAVKRHGLCLMHYRRLRKKGNVGPPHSLLGTSRGYKRVWRIEPSEGHQEGATDHGQVGPERRGVLEHRVVMERMLGRALYPGETVHHRNGKRRDNRPENLELWTGSHPHGVRVDDLLDWVVETYEEEITQRLLQRGNQP